MLRILCGNGETSVTCLNTYHVTVKNRNMTKTRHCPPPPGLLAAFRGRAREIFLEANVTGSRLLRQFCTYVGLMLKTAGHENQHISPDL